MAKTNHSARFATVRRYYEKGMWSASRVEKAVECGWITEAEYVEIVGEAYAPAE